jgi:predicted nuclease with RNAse H fold
MHYCGVVAIRGALQLAMLEEVRTPEPPIRLSAMFFEPGSPAQVAAELRALGDVVVAVAGPLVPVADGPPSRSCDRLLMQRGVPPERPSPLLVQLAGLLPELARFDPEHGDGPDGEVADGTYGRYPLFETNADGVYFALQGRRLPAKRHPLGMQLRIEELTGDRVVDESGDLWHRRMEELEAIACALCAHRYAVGHASWLGEPGEGVVVLPGSSIPEQFPREGVLPPVERLRLPPVTEA